MSDRDCFVFLDFETTGLDETLDRVIEVAAIRSTFSGDELGHYQTLINPGISVPEFITNLTGIDTPTIQRSGIAPSRAIDDLLNFINGDTVVAFNADFDVRFLLAEAKRSAIGIENLDYVCALASAQKAWPLFRRHNLKALSMFFGLPEQRHRALEDCRNGCRIFLYSSSAIGSKKIVDSLQLDKLCITSLDIEALYSCSSGDRLTLWTKPNLPMINAYAPDSLAGSGLVVSLAKEKNEWLLQQMNTGEVTELGVQREPGEPYEIFPITSPA